MVLLVMSGSIFLIYLFGTYKAYKDWEEYGEPTEEEINERSIQECPYCKHRQLSNISESVIGSTGRVGGVTNTSASIWNYLFGLKDYNSVSSYNTVSKNIVKRVVKCEACNSEYDYVPYIFETKKGKEDRWLKWRKTTIILGVVFICVILLVVGYNVSH